ncbi:hypothetical protein DICPUDRAFT_93168 [Dictyostelium purpureum]|uniref:HIG1 domain-containing protein n=1 Tax=Dictyostelium purpureum TaxID=5786 RepID=F1A3A1_DICPU|nr:uncharacterized protein DICPUDRAFT_93168 [Dictyostelium purpureum]EGC29328.1 hypothetical protein DICPUDRAFT_93168 [Dictyostelium purpureum]|eukprot:XP_003294144.1 hypothetical protein DICPUDRAFT_93168 [Dictyostelium purpureum]
MSQKKPQVIEPFEDLTGVGAPIKKESREQYLQRRHQEEDETRSAFYREGIKGGLLYSGITATGVAAGVLLSKTFKKNVTWNIRTFIISSGFIAGFWIWGEKASMSVIQQRLYKEMDQYYNQPHENKKQ